MWSVVISVALEAALNERIQQGGGVRRLWVVSDEKELELVAATCTLNAPRADYEVRVLPDPDSLPPMPWLIAGSHQAMIFVGFRY